MAQANLRLGSIGLHPCDWDQHYYPPDLPGDWVFDFLANELPVALLRPDELDAQCALHGAADWAELLDELQNEDFRLWLDLRGSDMPEGAALSALGQHLEGIIADRPLEGVPVPLWPESDCWSSQRPQARGPGLLTLQGDESPRALRALLESFEQACALDAPVLLVEAPRARFETLQTLVDLMGL